jgi:hypothetical protein
MGRLWLHSSVAIRFDGKRDAEGPLTIGQLNMYNWLSKRTETRYAMLNRGLALPPGTRLADLAETFAILLARHEGLRTICRPGDPPVQRVLAGGELHLQVYEYAAGPVDPAELTAELNRLLRAAPMEFDDLPLRVAVATRGGVPEALVFVCSHLAADYLAMAILRREVQQMLRDPTTRALGAARHQPLDRVEVEQRPAHQRRLAASIRHWSELVHSLPAQLYARPRIGPPGRAGALSMHSAAAAYAVDHISGRTRFNRSAVVLAAVSAVLSRRTGYPVCRFPTLSANRFERDLAEYVGTLVQSTILSVDVGEAGFDELVRRSFGAVITANRLGAYDVYRQIAAVQRIHYQRGIFVNFEPLLNNLGFTGAVPGTARPLPEVTAALADTGLSWQDTAPTVTLLRFDVDWGDGRLNCRIWSGDTGRVSRDEMTGLLLAVERLLVAAAAGDLDADGIRAALRLDPIERGPGWHLIDCCWVELAEVQHLLDDVVDTGPGRVFADVDGVPLVAYLVAGTGLRTPEAAHRRCMSAMPGRYTTMAPQRYVLCDAAPADPTDLESWRRQPVVAAGHGR